MRSFMRRRSSFAATPRIAKTISAKSGLPVLRRRRPFPTKFRCRHGPRFIRPRGRGRRRKPAHEAGAALSVSSTRRFWARPAAVLLDATGSASPKPRADSIAGFTPCEIRKFITVSARFWKE